MAECDVLEHLRGGQNSLTRDREASSLANCAMIRWMCATHTIILQSQVGKFLEAQASHSGVGVAIETGYNNNFGDE